MGGNQHATVGAHALAPKGEVEHPLPYHNTEVVSLWSQPSKHPPQQATTMKLYLGAALVSTAAITWHSVVLAVQCSSNCGACWKDNTPGVDTKTLCPADRNVHCV